MMQMAARNTPTRFSLVWAREMQTYRARQLQELLGTRDDEELASVVEQLKAASVLKTVAKHGPPDNDEETDNAFFRRYIGSYTYRFNYVGILMYCHGAHKRLLYIMPKYCNEQHDRWEHFSQVMRVLHRYAVNSRAHGQAAETNPMPDFLQVLVELVTDYTTNGAYRDDEQVDEINGNGRILWERTINRELPLLRNNRPLYMELHTRRRQQDELNFFTRLHQHLAHQAWLKLQEPGLTDLLQLPDIPVPEDSVDEFAEQEYVLGCIRQELARQFDSRRRYLLQLMQRYLQEETNDTDSGIHLFGKSSFHVVWEEACRTACGMSTSKADEMESSAPLWKLATGEVKGKGLQADMVKADEDTLTIYDAKYYTPPVEAQEVVATMPGIGDIIKQQLYQLAQNQELNKSTENVFILPMVDGEKGLDICHMGRVYVPMLTALGLVPVQILKVRPQKIWQAYLDNRTIQIQY